MIVHITGFVLFWVLQIPWLVFFDLGFSCHFLKIFRTLLVLAYFLKQLNRNKLWYPPNCMSFTLFNCSSLSCIILALSPAVTNLPNKTLIFHDFQGRKIKFHDFPGLENEIPGFPWPVRTLFHLVIRQRLSTARPCFNTIYYWNETWNDLLFFSAQLTQHFYNSTCVSPTLLLLANDRHVILIGMFYPLPFRTSIGNHVRTIIYSSPFRLWRNSLYSQHQTLFNYSSQLQ